ncbi:MAG: aminodeoxychorismate/anthranilate synthase component II [Fimbriimonadaceae bacterium]|nr:aminodeoxychorismate/anthranilate synthase component II [Fimbriimonadaceae bacterium]
MILVIDNYDSFTYNLVQELGKIGVEVAVHRNDQIDIRQIIALKPAGIMLSPGPCTPEQSGVCLNVVAEALKAEAGPFHGVPIFGVCLGHQAIGLVSGSVVQQAGKIMHGKTSQVRHDGKGLFANMPNPFRAVRYHSLVVTRETVPDGFDITGWSEDDDEVMGLRHRTLPVEGVQFHPESILTEQGEKIVHNFVNMVHAAQV